MARKIIGSGNWIVCQHGNSFCAISMVNPKMEVYDPKEIIKYTCKFYNTYRFDKQSAINMVDILNAKSPLTKVSSKTGNPQESLDNQKGTQNTPRGPLPVPVPP